MRARIAYISSLGTTAILVAAALLMLALVSAIVAFRGWPGIATGESVTSVPLAPRSAVRSAVKVKPAATARRLVRTQAARRPVAHRSRSTAGLVKRPRSGRSDLVPGLVMAPAATTTTPPPVAPHALSVTAPGRSPGTPTVRPSPQDPGVSLPDAGGLLPPVLPADGALQTAVDDAMTSVPQLPGVDVGDVTAHVPLGLGG